MAKIPIQRHHLPLSSAAAKLIASQQVQNVLGGVSALLSSGMRCASREIPDRWGVLLLQRLQGYSTTRGMGMAVTRDHIAEGYALRVVFATFDWHHQAP